MDTENRTRKLIAILLRLALVCGLALAGWSVYRRLPRAGSAVLSGGAADARETKLHVIMRGVAGTDNEGGAVKSAGATAARADGVAVRLYSIDVSSAQREFLSEPRRGVRLEQFMAERMGNRPVVEGRFDERGRVTLAIPSGLWWVHATLPSAQETTWRLRVNVSGREQTVELTPDNAYTRTKSF